MLIYMDWPKTTKYLKIYIVKWNNLYRCPTVAYFLCNSITTRLTKNILYKTCMDLRTVCNKIFQNSKIGVT